MKAWMWSVVCAMLLGAPALRAAEYKMAVVDIQDVIDAVEEGKTAKAQMEKEMTAKKKELEDKRLAVTKLEENLEKQKLVLSAPALADKQKELDAKKADFQRTYMNAQSEMQKREMELSGDILKKITAVVTKIGKDQGFDFILEKSRGSVVYNKDTYDVTKQVVDLYNKTYKK